MADKPTGLYDLVARVRQRWEWTHEIRHWFWDHQDLPDEQASLGLSVASRLADAVLQLVWQGQYGRASRLASLDPRPEDYDLTEGLEALAECPAWQPFRDACGLAERIDSFVATLAADRVGAAFASDCRRDVNTLLVLADWCADNGLPAAAAEARHLHALARMTR